MLELSLYAKEGLMTISNTSVFAGRVSSLSWENQSICTKDASELAAANPGILICALGHATFEELQVIANHCPAVQNIEIYTLTATDDEISVLSRGCSRLQELIIYQCNTQCVLDTGLIALARQCREMKTIGIFNPSAVSDAAVVALCTQCRQLTSLILYGGFLTTAALTGLVASRASWTEVSIGWKVDSLTVWGSDMQLFKSLRQLAIQSVFPDCEHTLQFALAHMPGLEVFTTGEEPFPMEVLTCVTQHCKGLKTLDVRAPVRGSSEASLTQIFAACPCLATLRWTTERLTEKALIAIAESYPNLTSISVKVASTVTDAVLVELLRQCRKLTSLSICGGTLLTDETLSAVAQYERSITYLYLKDSSLVTPAGILSALQSCYWLRFVEFPSSVLDQEATALIRTELGPRRRRVFINGKA
jgi:hypothetical protein